MSYEAVIRRPFAWLMAIVVGLLAYYAFPIPAGVLDKEPPERLVYEVMSHPIVTMDTCTLTDLGLQAVECIASYDAKNRRSWIILFDSDMKMTMVVMYDGKTNVLWCRQGSCT